MRAKLPINKIKSHKFNGKKYRIKYRKPKNCEGLCEHPKYPDRHIWINPNNTEQEFCGLALHEGLHAACFFLDEETVERTADELCNFLWRLGFRLQKK